MNAEEYAEYHLKQPPLTMTCLVCSGTINKVPYSIIQHSEDDGTYFLFFHRTCFYSVAGQKYCVEKA
jgi:hypothetical protein